MFAILVSAAWLWLTDRDSAIVRFIFGLEG